MGISGWGAGNVAIQRDPIPAGTVDLADLGFDVATQAELDAHLHTGTYALGLTPTAVKTANYSAVAGDFVPVDTTSGNVTVTLPAAPADGSRIAVKHVIQGGTNVVTYATGGSDVFNKAGGTTSGTLPLLAQAANFQYKASSGIWYIVANYMPLSQLDLRYVADSFQFGLLAKAFSNTNWNTFNQSSSDWNGGERLSSGAQNAEVVYVLQIALRAGTWDFAIAHRTGSNRGIYDIAVSADAAAWTSVGTVDSYNASNTNVRSEVTGVAVAAGIKYVRLKMATKNASSSSYFGSLSDLSAARTGA